MRCPHDEENDDPHDRDATPQDAAKSVRRHRDDEMADRLKKAKSILSDREQEVIELCVEKSVPVKEVAEMLGLSARRVREIRQRALVALRSLLL